MGNRIFKALLNEKIDIFKNSFNSISKEIFFDELTKELIHPGEYGMYRETICKEFIRFIIPKRLEIEQGFLINSNEQISHQCDIVVFDKQNTPLIENSEKQRFFPIETVCAIGEVKSKLSKTQLKEALNKLSKIKPLRNNLKSTDIVRSETDGSFNPEDNLHDQIITFLICQKLDFDINNIESEIDLLYDKENINYKHNFILSIEDGLIIYKNNENVVIPFPKHNQAFYESYFIRTESNNNSFNVFASNLFLTTSSTTVLFPHIANYLI